MTKAIATQEVDFSPLVEVPSNAPALRIDIHNPHLTFDDVLPSNYISMERLQEWCNDRGVDNRVLTANGITVELVYDPSKETPEQGKWRPCLHFVETESMLVCNVTRCGQIKKITKSPLLAKAATMGAVQLKAGVYNGKAQIGILPVPDGWDLDAANELIMGFS